MMFGGEKKMIQGGRFDFFLKGKGRKIKPTEKRKLGQYFTGHRVHRVLQ